LPEIAQVTPVGPGKQKAKLVTIGICDQKSDQVQVILVAQSLQRRNFFIEGILIVVS
jgi:hypothetical protein